MLSGKNLDSERENYKQFLKLYNFGGKLCHNGSYLDEGETGYSSLSQIVSWQQVVYLKSSLLSLDNSTRIKFYSAAMSNTGEQNEIDRFKNLLFELGEENLHEALRQTQSLLIKTCRRKR